MDAVPPPAAPAAAPAPRNRYGPAEWAGAFGDLGTFIPFVAAYIGVVGLDPFGVLFAFGVALVGCGWRYRTPMPVQPMKAIGAAAAVQAGTLGAGAVHAAALVTGLVWLLLGLSGWIAGALRRVPPWLVLAVVLGLGAAFVWQGLHMMAQGWPLAAAALALAWALRRSRAFPAMFALLALGTAAGAWHHPELLQRLAAIPLELRWPSFAPAHLQWEALVGGTLMLALPQMPLTLGNAIVAMRQQNNRLFPQRPVAEGELAVSTGLMNLFSGCVGGVPLCHGAGGMAGHVAFGARTGGAVVVLGLLLLALALFFSPGVSLLFELFAAPVLGAMLLVSGLQLARGAAWPAGGRERVLLLGCAAVCAWNVAAGFAIGLLAHRAWRPRSGQA